MVQIPKNNRANKTYDKIKLNFAFKQYPDRISFYKQKMYIEFFKLYRNWFPAIEYDENTIKIYEDMETIIRLVDFLIRHLENR